MPLGAVFEPTLNIITIMPHHDGSLGMPGPGLILMWWRSLAVAPFVASKTIVKSCHGSDCCLLLVQQQLSADWEFAVHNPQKRSFGLTQLHKRGL